MTFKYLVAWIITTKVCYPMNSLLKKQFNEKDNKKEDRNLITVLNHKDKKKSSFGHEPGNSRQIPNLAETKKILGNLGAVRYFGQKRMNGSKLTPELTQSFSGYKHHGFNSLPENGTHKSVRFTSTEKQIQLFPSENTSGQNQHIFSYGEAGITETKQDIFTQERTNPVIVDDSAAELIAGQMRKSEFLTSLRVAVNNTAESALSGTIWSVVGCPWIDYWLGYYGNQSAGRIEQAIRKFTAEKGRTDSASQLIVIICDRLRSGIETWTQTGTLRGIPDGVPTGIPGNNGKQAGGGRGGLLFKNKESEDVRTVAPNMVRAGLGQGRPLDTSVRSRMEPVFGYNFSHVRVHNKPDDARLSRRMNARAFTIGRDIAFDADEYRPGTLEGDALIAHELAHVVQQGIHSENTPVMSSPDSAQTLMEAEADHSALNVVLSLWGNAGTGIRNITEKFKTGVKSGLRLQRCSSHNEDAAERIKKSSSNNVEVLALLFESNEIKDDGTVSGRLKTILEITESSLVPGLQTGKPFEKSDEGFKEEYKDPWPSSRNQAGHFLTAVGFGFDPSVVQRNMAGKPIRFWIGAPKSMSDEEVAIRLMIGHEKAPDPGYFRAVGECMLENSEGKRVTYPESTPSIDCMGEAPYRMLQGFRKQFNRATDKDVKQFLELRKKITKKDLKSEDLEGIETYVQSVNINPEDQGCSRQDMRLSIMGWVLGELIRNGKFGSRTEVAEWLRKYLSE